MALTGSPNGSNGRPLNFYDYNPLPGQKKLAPAGPRKQVRFDKYSDPGFVNYGKLLDAIQKSLVKPKPIRVDATWGVKDAPAAAAAIAAAKNPVKPTPVIPATASYPGGAPAATTDPPAPVAKSAVGADPNAALYQRIAALLNGGGNPAEASALARQAINAAVNDYRLQQHQLISQGHSNALNILAAAEAAGNLGNQLPGVIKGNYEDAAKQLAAIAGGYSGSLRDTAVGEANADRSSVAQLGLTPTSVTPSGLDLLKAPADAANAAYGVHGAIPATALVNSGLNAFNEFSQMPGLIAAGGKQEALLAQGAANEKANSLFANIANERAKMPQLVQSYLASLSSADQKKALTLLSIAKASGSLGGSAFDPSASNFYGIAMGKNGQPKLDANGNLVAKTGYHIVNGLGVKNTPKAKPSSLTANESDNIWGKIQKFVNAAPSGNYSTPQISQGQGYQFRIASSLSANDAWHQVVDAHPQIFKNREALNRLLEMIQRTWGVPFQISPRGDLTTFVGLQGSNAANAAGASPPVIRIPLG